MTLSVVGSIRTEDQAQRNRENNIIVTGPITENDCIAVFDVAEEIGVTLTETPFDVQKFGEDNKHVDFRFTDRKLRLKYSGKLKE